MYILFREFHWEPSRYFSMPESEKVVTRAFISRYADERKEEQEELDRAARRLGK